MRHYNKMRYYRILVKFDRDDEYTTYLKANGLEDTDVIDYMSKHSMFHGEMDVSYVREITEITRKEYETATKSVKNKA